MVGVVAQRERLDAEIESFVALLADRLLQPFVFGGPVRLPFPHLRQADEAVGIAPHLLTVVLVERAVDVVVLQDAHVHADKVHLADHAFGRRLAVDQTGRIGLYEVVDAFNGDLGAAEVGQAKVDIRHLVEVVGVPIQERLGHRLAVRHARKRRLSRM